MQGVFCFGALHTICLSYGKFSWFQDNEKTRRWVPCASGTLQIQPVSRKIAWFHEWKHMPGSASLEGQEACRDNRTNIATWCFTLRICTGATSPSRARKHVVLVGIVAVSSKQNIESGGGSM